ncbi:hypothetical protein B488_05650 [Liberibacter crescens BT-1]|uniref:Macrolide export ATP-binding/permease protein MacB n=1 Tax=Liberibacter crescens (strain BT-1) TaxID=1215343 RepID=L0EUD3_LIBCB|nr:ABC transporter permease [Liberibacter crescens]AGA64557.1 hypothetical protein B488_05650 [Liberibacter crescens BT-1]AMC12700.1 multidrug ABC transporter substrate-binding protein [Liberibacter crescens]
MFLETLKLALLAISRNVLRSCLTITGIVIGIAAVMIMMTVGHGVKHQITANMEKFGTNKLFIMLRPHLPGKSRDNVQRFSNKDFKVIRNQISGLRAIAPTAKSSLTVVYTNHNHLTEVVGANNEYLIANNLEILKGRKFLQEEERGLNNVCVIGKTVQDEVFNVENPLGKYIRIGGHTACNVIGILEAKGQSLEGEDMDDVVLMNFNAYQQRIGKKNEIPSIVLSVRDGISTSKVKSEIEILLREQRHILPGYPDNFIVRDMAEVISSTQNTVSLLTNLLSAVAAVSLLVGGIGIMNIVMVSVAERTREIGIRLAIGALERQVLMQFLIEAIILSVSGGAIGILLGLILSYLFTIFMGLPFSLDFFTILLSFGISSAIGVLFGYFPARKAAYLNPIEALRYE